MIVYTYMFLCVYPERQQQTASSSLFSLVLMVRRPCSISRIVYWYSEFYTKTIIDLSHHTALSLADLISSPLISSDCFTCSRIHVLRQASQATISSKPSLPSLPSPSPANFSITYIRVGTCVSCVAYLRVSKHSTIAAAAYLRRSLRRESERERHTQNHNMP